MNNCVELQRRLQKSTKIKQNIELKKKKLVHMNRDEKCEHSLTEVIKHKMT